MSHSSRHRPTSRLWGLARPPALSVAATREMQRWRWPVLAALLCTIPAFYIELLEQLPTPLATAIYLSAAGLIALSQWRVSRHLDHPLQHLRRNALDLLLAVGFMLSALLPASVDSPLSLAIRLAVALLSLVHMVWTLRPWLTRGGLGYLLLLAFAVLCFCGVGFWALEPRVRTLGDGLWLAFTTAATVGYGDIVPSTPAAKIFAVFVVLLGYAVLSLVTAAIAAMWVETSERRIEHDILRQLHAEVSALRGEIAALKRPDDTAQ
ncbi:potassium channel family protein [Roseateles cellulosilyticus]|uniref:Potassium channel family protein n=1 Tax=Pelomonas cellulosilytica TaxID=2906762 RepID=A0ABS8XUT6_9BURK|nr:potassium channel family protein [Pelomonas sp. P8]MCE4556464.1 potassium channel family protein [Pelomonas sp. P8]